MDTAGSINGGRIVWALGTLKDKFAVFGDDKVQARILFTNPHTYASSISIRTVMERVVCANTLSFALSEKSARMFKQSHKTVFDADEAEAQLGVVSDRMAVYKDQALFLGSKKAKTEDVVEFFQRVFPVYKAPAKKKQLLDANGNLIVPRLEPEVEAAKARKEISKTAEIAKAVLETQPGAQYARGTWWQAFNAVTFTVDHLKGKSDERRFGEALLGTGASQKNRALELALEYAGK